MKRVIAGLGALFFSALAFSATTTPVQLLSPTGSTAGQAIISTGASSAPTWGTAGLSAISGNSVIANTAGAPAIPSGLAVPSCSTSNSAIKWVTNTGFTCGTAFALTSGNLSQFASTTSAQMAGVISDETGSGSMVFSASPTFSGTAGFSALTSTSGVFSGDVSLNYTPTTQRKLLWTNAGVARWVIQTDGVAESGGDVGSNLLISRFSDAGSFINNPIAINRSTGRTTLALATITGALTTSQTAGIVGTTTNNNADAGSVGEYVTNTASGVSLTSSTSANLTSVSLTAGDWDVQAIGQFVPAGGTTIATENISVSTTSATLGATLGSLQSLNITHTAGQGDVLTSPVVRVSIASTTTVYAVANSNFSGSTLTANGFIRARRVR